MLFMRAPELIHLVTESWHPLSNIFPSSPLPAPGNQHSALSKALALKEKKDQDSHNATVN